MGQKRPPQTLRAGVDAGAGRSAASIHRALEWLNGISKGVLMIEQNPLVTFDLTKERSQPIYITHKASCHNFASGFGLTAFTTLPLFHNHGREFVAAQLICKIR
jgi:hypothetical protein